MNRKLSESEPVSQLRHVPIVECSEDLVDFLALCPDLLLDRPRYKYRRETLLRRRAAEMLCDANRRLPRGYKLAIIEGWRPPYIQRRMYKTVWQMFAERHPDWSRAKLVLTVNRFTAPLDRKVPPPHTTGGAIDLVLVEPDGKTADHCNPYDPLDPAGFLTAAPGLSESAKETRRILAEALSPAGLTNYPSEYWHWSYGDQGWAYRGGHANALYGQIQPPEWRPSPDDDIDETLEREG